MTSKPDKRKVFVSYSRDDTRDVLPLVDWLEKNSGVSFWIDRDGIESAAQFEDVIIRAIDHAEVVLFMLSDNSQQSQWTKDEISYAKNMGKRVVPIVLHGGELKGWFLFKFGRINYIDASENEQLQRLASDIREWLHTGFDQTPTEGKSHMSTATSNTSTKKEVDAATSSMESMRGSASLFFRKNRKGCTLSLTLALVCCTVIVFVLPQLMWFRAGSSPESTQSLIDKKLSALSPNTTRDSLKNLLEDSIKLEISKLSAKPAKAALTCPNCGGKGVVCTNGDTLACIACGGLGRLTDKTPMGVADGHIYVDLGLSVRWANCNVGANSPQNSGAYFAWAETSPKIDYLKDNNSPLSNETKIDIGGDSMYDAARANWGKIWRLPTKAEAQELIEKCKWEWSELQGQTGCKVTGPSGLSIFFPACGLRKEGSLLWEGEFCVYWTSSAETLGEAFALTVEQSPFRYQLPSTARYVGYNIRPVSE